MNHCPVYTRIGGHAYGTTYPGPIGSHHLPHMLGLEATKDLPTASSLCGACGEVCPVKIPIPDLLMRLRKEVAAWKASSGWPLTPRLAQRYGASPASFRLSMPSKLGPWTELPCRAQAGQGFAARTGQATSGEKDRYRRRAFMSARDNILKRLRERTDGALTAPQSDFSVVTGRGWSQEERLERFERLITSVHGEVIHVAQANWTAELVELLHAKGIRRLALGREHPVAAEARAALDRQGRGAGRCRPRYRGLAARAVPQTDAGLTSTRGAIAETGSLWLWPTPDEPRLLSLVPPIHIAVLDADSLEDTFFDVVEAHGWAGGMPTNALLISGPSKTADIEQTLAYGVHGPASWWCWCVTPRSAHDSAPPVTMTPTPMPGSAEKRLLEIMPAERLIDDPLRTLAYGTDASFYRLIPKLVVRPPTRTS
jgi:L-lactate dehydrogenase complex protein LldG